MQALFGGNPELLNKIKGSLSAPRLSRYLALAKGDDIYALELYKWNVQLSQALYPYIQAWEVCLRNKLDGFLSWKFGPSWPYEQRLQRQLNSNDRRRLDECKTRQERDRGMNPAPTSAIVADLSAGFWVSLLTYKVPFSWRYNLVRVFPRDNQLTSENAHTDCDDLLNLRNRVAHHEAILALPLDVRHQQLQRTVLAMCDATSAFADRVCTFEAVWKNRP